MNSEQHEAPSAQDVGEAFGIGFFGEMKICTGMFGIACERVQRVRWFEDRAGEDQRRRLPGGAGDREHGRGDDPAERAGQDDAEHGAPAADPERVGGFAQALGDEQQHLLGPRAISGSMMIASATEAGEPDCCLWLTSRPKTKSPMMIEGRPFIRSSVSRIRLAQPRSAGELGQEEGDEDADRHRDRGRDRDDRSDDARRDPAAGLPTSAASLIRKSSSSALAPRRTTE